MSLSESRVRATVGVSDIARAAEFYEGKLGLSGATGGPQVRIYECGSGSQLQLHESGHAGGSGATAVSWTLPDFDAEVQALLAAGISFERYEGMDADENGVHAFGNHKIAWFKDPDGNIIALDNGNGA